MNQGQLNTPVVLMMFKRPDMTQKVFELIRQVKPPKLLVIADGPRQDRPEEAQLCAAARAVVEQVDWDCEVMKNYSDVNLGCRTRVYTGLNWVFQNVEEAIILEDDCVAHPSFFRFCQELLERYRYDDRVMLIGGDNTHQYQATKYSYYFSQYALIWGWATWRSAWQYYDNSMALWPKLRDENWLSTFLPNQRAIDYWTKIMQDNYEGYSSWARAWMFSCWIRKGLCIVPRINLISNIGFDEHSTHTLSKSNKRAYAATQEMYFPLYHPPQVTRDLQAEDLMEKVIFSGDPQAIVKQALEKLNLCESKQALSLFNKAIESLPKLPGLHYGKALALAQLERKSEAVEVLNQLVKVAPKHRKAKFLLDELRENLWPAWLPHKSEFEKSLLEFLEVYEKRPIQNNEGGVKSIGAFTLWFFLKRDHPKLVIESGVFKGLTTWIIEQAVPEAKIICFDPNPKQRVYNSQVAIYESGDFISFDFADYDLSQSLAFFDDGQNIYDRTLQAKEKGFTRLIVNNNYLSPPPEKNSLQSYLYQGGREAENLQKMIEEYIVFPPLFKPKNISMEQVATNKKYVPNEALQLSQVPELERFKDEINTFRWMSYIKLIVN
jgi:tetratricopeptide (TPR) repeat protein